MDLSINKPIRVAVPFMWIGFVAAISFMEAWLKFQAPGVSLSIGLGIGQLVFSALNKVEWVLALLVLAAIVLQSNKKCKTNAFLLIPVLLLILQTFWLLPALNERANNIIQGLSIGESTNHLYFVLFEIIKVVSLFIFGIKQLKNS